MNRLFLSLLIAGAVPLSGGNLLHNSSFELGICGWQICNFIPLENRILTYQKPEFDKKSKIHGSQSLKCVNPRGEWMQMISHEFQLQDGKEYTFSAWMKSDRPLTLKMDFFTVTHNPPEVQNKWYSRSKSFRLSPDWKRYSFTIRGEKPHLYPFLRLSWNGGTVWFDAVQVNPGKITDYAPSAGLEFAVEGAERFAGAGEERLVLKGVNYTDAPADGVFGMEYRDIYFDKVFAARKYPVKLAAKGSFRTRLRVPSRYGVFRVAGNVNCKGKEYSVIPWDFGCAPELSAARIDPDRSFVLGYSSAAGAFPNPAGKREYRALGVDYEKYYKNLRRQGIRINRLHDDGVFGWENIEREPGVYDWRVLDNVIDTGLKYGIETMPVLGGRAMLDNVNRKDLDHWHIRKGSRKTRGFHSNCGWLPPEKAWSDFVYNLVRHCKGRVRYYEIVNEPNLYMTPEDYTRYLKLAYEAAKKADPACRIVGICSTGDLGGNLGDFIEACGKLGAFRSLDILSFHPYSAQLDSSPTPAEVQLREIRKIADQYRKGVPLWNSELYYIKSNEEHGRIGNLTDWILSGRFPACNTLRRYLIDLGGGLKSSISLTAAQSLHNDLRPHFGYSNHWAVAEQIPNAHCIVGNSFARFLEGAEPVRQLKLLSGVNGWLYRDRSGGQVAAFWAKDDDGRFKFRFNSAGTELYDLFGNPVPARSWIPLTANPYYLAGKDLSCALASLTIVPERLYTVTGVHSIVQNGRPVLAVELRNNSAASLPLSVRIMGGKTLRSVTLKGEEARTLFFPAVSAETEPVTVLVSAGETVESYRIRPVYRKAAGNGETVSMNGYRFRVNSDAAGLTVSVEVRDSVRGERRNGAPWEGDCVELFFDGCPWKRLDRNSYTDDVVRLFLAPGSSNGLPELFSASRNFRTETCKYEIRETKTFYSVTVTIPWSSLNRSAPEPAGFDIIVNNSNGKKRDSAEPWAGNEYNWRDRFNFGIYMP